MIINANAAFIPLADKSVHCAVTSPPYYSLRQYDGAQELDWPKVEYAPMPALPPLAVPAMTCPLGLEPTPHAFIAHLVLIFREVRRVLRDDGVCWVVFGDSYSKSAGGQSGGKNYTSDAGNISRMDTTTTAQAGNLMMLPHQFALAAQADGWIVRNDVVWHKVNPMPESMAGWRFEKGALRRGSWRHTRAHEFVFMLTKKMQYWSNQERVREALVSIDRVKSYGYYGGNRRFETDVDAARMGVRDNRDALNKANVSGRNPRSVLTPKPETYAGPHYACVDAETECLTIGGWKRYDQLREGMPIFTYNMQNRQLEIQPIETLSIYEYKGDLLSVFGRSSNMVMTPNHNCVIGRFLHRKKKMGNPTFVRADELKQGMKFYVCAPMSAKDTMTNLSDGIDFFELLGWIVSEGSYHDAGGVKLYQSLSANAAGVKMIDALLTNWPSCFSRRVDHKTRGVEVTWTLKGELRKRIKLFIPDKFRIPEHFLMLPQSYLDAFLKGFVGGDGHIRDDKRISISQKSKPVIDMIQAMFLRSNRSCVLSQRGNGIWTAFVSNSTSRHFRNSKSSLIRNDYSYHGLVWCPAVKNRTWVARRGGRPFITGNSYPSSLIAPLIRATCPDRCCSVCGAGWSPVVERGEVISRGGSDTGILAASNHYGDDIGNRARRNNKALEQRANIVKSYRPTCDCNADHTPGAVLDPFVGSGTTLMVAKELGLNGIGLDLSFEYLDLQAKVRSKEGVPSNALDELPLFEGLT